MKKSTLKPIVITAIILQCSLSLISQSFEGVIEFRKSTLTDTTNYIYTVGDNIVRIDEIGNRSNKIEGSFIVDLNENTMKFLNHDRKLYGDQKNPPSPIVKGNCTVNKTDNIKNLQGYKCREYIVTNTEENTKIVYYLADGKFSFFEKLLRLLNRKEKSAVYYLRISDIKNKFPMLSIETNLNEDFVTKLEVTKITRKEVDPALFDIPKGYNKFEK